MNEIERHWDRICLMVLTIATAAPAAALLIFRETSQTGSPMGWMRILPAFIVLGITGAYGIAVLRAGGAIMAPQDGNEGAGKRPAPAAARNSAGKSFQEKIARLTAQWLEQQAKTQRLDAAITENMERLGFDETQRVRRRLEASPWR